MKKTMEIFSTITDDELFPTVHIGISTRYFKPIENNNSPLNRVKEFRRIPMDI